MPDIFVGGKKIDIGLVCTHWSGWGRKASIERRSPGYRIEWSHNEILEKFGSYWCSFVERESEDDGDPTSPCGIYAELEAACYPSLEEMLLQHGDLFARLVSMHLQSEFIGFLVPPPRDIARRPAWFLCTLTKAQVDKAKVSLEGQCLPFCT